MFREKGESRRRFRWMNRGWGYKVNIPSPYMDSLPGGRDSTIVPESSAWLERQPPSEGRDS